MITHISLSGNYIRTIQDDDLRGYANVLIDLRAQRNAPCVSTRMRLPIPSGVRIYGLCDVTVCSN